jgi:ribosome-associated protein
VIRVTGRVILDERDLAESFIRASGPGGQNVNKVETGVQLRFTLNGLSQIPDTVRERLRKLAGRRLTQDDVLVIEAQRFRSQDRNRADAQERLVALLREAAVEPRIRRPTRPTLASKERRLTSKTKRAGIKRERGRTSDD